MTLTIGPAGDFVYTTHTPEGKRAAQETGLTFSTSASRGDRNVFFTREAYAALPFISEADYKAKETLRDLSWEYRCSFLTEGSGIHLSVPPDRELMPFQKAGVEYALGRKNVLIGDQPGLGKTAQAIVLANEMRAKRVLVICPANVRRHWRREIMAWSTAERPRGYLIEKSSDGVSPTALFTITSFELMRSPSIHAALMREHFDLIVIDEAHYLKTPQALRTRALFGGGQFRTWLAQRAEKVVALTGTPLPNRPRECYTLARALCWDAIDWMSEDAFKFRFNPSFKDWETGFAREDVGRLPELQARLRCNFMVRRMKSEVLTQLPAKTLEVVQLDPDADVKKVLRAEGPLTNLPLDELYKLIATDFSVGGTPISTLRRMMGEATAPLVADHLEYLLDSGVEKMFVAVHHRSVMKLLVERLGKHGVVTIDGSTSPAGREMRKEEFVNDPKCHFLFGQLQAAGIGIDGLQHASSFVVFAEASFVPGENEQFIDRLHRHGQKSHVQAQFLVAPGSISEKILGDFVAKAHEIHDALDKRFM